MKNIVVFFLVHFEFVIHFKNNFERDEIYGSGNASGLKKWILMAIMGFGLIVC